MQNFVPKTWLYPNKYGIYTLYIYSIYIYIYILQYYMKLMQYTGCKQSPWTNFNIQFNGCLNTYMT